jgi:hypothetical protein
VTSEAHTKFWLESLKGKDQLELQSIGERIINIKMDLRDAGFRWCELASSGSG